MLIIDTPVNDPCATNNPCSDICTAKNGVAVCTCKAGRVFQSTSTSICVDLPVPAKIKLLVKNDVTATSVSGISGQDTFTSAIESSFPSLVGYLNFDAATYDGTKSTVTLEIEAQSTTITGQIKAQVLTNYIKNPSTLPAFATAYPPISPQIDTNTAVDAPTSSPATQTPIATTSQPTTTSKPTTTLPTQSPSTSQPTSSKSSTPSSTTIKPTSNIPATTTVSPTATKIASSTPTGTSTSSTTQTPASGSYKPTGVVITDNGDGSMVRGRGMVMTSVMSMIVGVLLYCMF